MKRDAAAVVIGVIATAAICCGASSITKDDVHNFIQDTVRPFARYGVNAESPPPVGEGWRVSHREPVRK